MISESSLLALEKLPMSCTARKCARSQESMSRSGGGAGEARVGRERQRESLSESSVGQGSRPTVQIGS